MFFQEQLTWFKTINKPDEKITAVAFEIPATKIMDNLSAKAAIRMQTEETDKFTEMVEKLHNADACSFSIHCKESSKNEVKGPDFVVEKFEKQN